MPREAARNEIGRSTREGIEYVTYECPFKDGEVDKSVTVEVPASPKDFQTYILGLPVAEDSPLVQAYDRWLGATVTAAKAAEREAAAAESTVVKRDGKDIDILSMKSDRGIEDPENVKFAAALINASYMQSNAFGWDGKTSGKGTSAPQNAFVVARRKLVEAKKAELVGEGPDHTKMLKPVAA